MKSRKLLLTAILGVVLAATIGTTPPGLAEDSSEQKYFQKTGITFEDPPGQPKITRQEAIDIAKSIYGPAFNAAKTIQARHALFSLAGTVVRGRPIDKVNAWVVSLYNIPDVASHAPDRPEMWLYWDHYVVIDADTGEYILAISRGKIDEPAPVPPWAKTGTN